MKQIKFPLPKMVCEVEDDEGTICGREMSDKQYRQDGMCERCAELLWENYARPMISGGKTKPIIFSEGK